MKKLSKLNPTKQTMILKLMIVYVRHPIHLDKKEKRGNLGIFIGNKEYKSKGYALQSSKMVINYLIKKNIVNSIVSGTKNENLKMIRLMKNLKMKKIPKKDTKHTNYIFKKP